MTVRLSRRQIGDADRVGGIELMILYPESLGEPGSLADDDEREATPAEKAAAEALVREACTAAGLVPVHVRVARVQRPGSLPTPGYHTHLAITIIGRRWVHASTHNPGRVSFATT